MNDIDFIYLYIRIINHVKRSNDLIMRISMFRFRTIFRNY